MHVGGGGGFEFGEGKMGEGGEGFVVFEYVVGFGTFRMDEGLWAVVCV